MRSKCAHNNTDREKKRVESGKTKKRRINQIRRKVSEEGKKHFSMQKKKDVQKQEEQHEIMQKKHAGAKAGKS